MPTSDASVERVFRLQGDVLGEARVFVLNEGENSVGASPGCEIHIPIQQVSRRHAVLHVDSEGVRLEDLDSTNGTFVNGVRVRKARLKESDWIQFGPALMTFESMSVDEHELAISLESGPSDHHREIDGPGVTTEIGIPPKTSIAWAPTLERCAALLISRWTPDLGEAMSVLSAAIDGTLIALLVHPSNGEIAVLAATGDASVLQPWREKDAFDGLRPRTTRGGRVSTHELSFNPPASAAISWTESSWESALVVVGAEIGDTERQFLAVALRMLQSATLPVPEIGRPEATVSEDDLVFPEWHVVGQTPVMRTLYKQLATLTNGTMPVLVTGETGVGKEHIVRILHASSDRATGPLQVVNCTAIPADLLEAELFGIEAGVATGVSRRTGKLRLAHGGVLFLDEIGDMDLALQAKLLRALQEGEVHPLGAASPITVNVRIVAATNTQLEQRVADNQFRKDLYYRIAGCELEVPPLRHRREDIPALAQFFLSRAASESRKSIRGLSVSALESLQQAFWPGNIRQLQRELTRLVTSCPRGHTIESDMISPAIFGGAEDAPPTIGGESLDLKNLVAAVEKSLIERALDQSEGNHSKAARLLGVTRNGLTMKMRRLGIDRNSK